MKIIADKNIPYLKGIVEQYGETTYLSGAEFTKEAIADADTLIVRTVTHFDQKLLENSKVKLICSATIGYDHIDTEYCDKHNIKWTNAPGCNSGSVQQYITSVLLTLADKHSLDLKEMTIGIIGVGNVGKKVANICQLLGMKVLQNDPPRATKEDSHCFVSLDEIKEQADIITFHTPLNKSGEFKTYHLADELFFSSLKRKPYIINSARGAIIDTNAILKAIHSKQITAAIVDCWENEPSINLDYLNTATIATPHIAGYSADGKANATRMSLLSIAKYWNLDSNIADLVKPNNLEKTEINLDLFGNDKWSRIKGALLFTYSPMLDDKKLRNNPDSFKELRNSYPLRRENKAFTILNIKLEEQKIFQSLGFQIK